MNDHRSLAVFALLSLAACGGSTEPTKDATDTTLTATPTSEAVSSASADASAAPSAGPASSAMPDAEATAKAEPKGPFHYTDYKGPKVKASISTPTVWGVQPVGAKNEWDILKLMHEDFVRAEGDEIVIKHFDGSEIFIPGALVYPAAPAKGLKAGDTVLADVAASSAPARVVRLEGAGDDQSIELKYMWAGSSSDATLSPNGVVKLEDKVAFGQPVAWKKDGAWEIGDFAGGDATTGFVIESGGHAVLMPKKDLKPLKITRVFKKGDKVWASRYGSLKPGKVTEVVEGGLAYKVQLDSGEATPDPFEFGGVTSPLE